MTTNEKGNTAFDFPAGTKPDGKIAAAIRRRLQSGKLPCARAFEIARELSVPLLKIGYTADLLHIRIVQCQMGLFGYEPEKRIVQAASVVEQPLEKAIRERLINGRLPCAAAFAISRELRIPKMDVSAACETQKIKVSSCQLGAFA